MHSQNKTQNGYLAKNSHFRLSQIYLLSSQKIFLRSETANSIAFCKNIHPQEISKLLEHCNPSKFSIWIHSACVVN